MVTKITAKYPEYKSWLNEPVKPQKEPIAAPPKQEPAFESSDARAKRLGAKPFSPAKFGTEIAKAATLPQRGIRSLGVVLQGLSTGYQPPGF